MHPPKIRGKKTKAGNREITDLDDDVRFGDPENEIYDLSDVSGDEGAKGVAQTVLGAGRGVSPASPDASQHTDEDGEDDRENDDADTIQSGADALLASYSIAPVLIYLNLIDRISIKYRYYPRYGVYGAQGYRYLNLIVDISIK
ncbi:hypothetical protein P167DRAFT_550488 [Morchella conica CCBAS932]|uniref:Uncharacterized protein n=1 Tax=Morchella conica CCBAS932 TaxID=1392247 RepID=A0A3N4K7G6_9PEZI|nr:hypothetical protein P167DRAFT_550488 [Morchella conica CCBAS932]